MQVSALCAGDGKETTPNVRDAGCACLQALLRRAASLTHAAGAKRQLSGLIGRAVPNLLKQLEVRGASPPLRRRAGSYPHPKKPCTLDLTYHYKHRDQPPCLGCVVPPVGSQPTPQAGHF